MACLIIARHRRKEDAVDFFVRWERDHRFAGNYPKHYLPVWGKKAHAKVYPHGTICRTAIAVADLKSHLESWIHDRLYIVPQAWSIERIKRDGGKA